MSSYVANSIFKQQTHEASSCNVMNSLGSYGSLSDFDQANYAYNGGLHDFNGTFTSSDATVNSLKREEMNSSLRGNTDTQSPPRPQSYSALSSRNSVQNCLSDGILSKATEMQMEVVETPRTTTEESAIKVETMQPVKHQIHSKKHQDSQQQPQIFPWMTKLHMIHGKLICKMYIAYYFPHSLSRLQSCFCPFTVFPLEFYWPNAGNNKTGGHKFWQRHLLLVNLFCYCE